MTLDRCLFQFKFRKNVFAKRNALFELALFAEFIYLCKFGILRRINLLDPFTVPDDLFRFSVGTNRLHMTY